MEARPFIEKREHDLSCNRTWNEIALKNDYLYEEFILFGIYPNGGQSYQKIRDVMVLTPDSAAISIGLEPLDTNWTLNLNKNQSK